MKLTVLLSTVIFTTCVMGQSAKQKFEIPNLTQELSKHKIVAILPFRVTISYKKLPKGFDAEGNKQDELKQGVIMQQGMYTYLLRKSKDYFVSFQEVERTNILLKKFELFDKIDEILPDSLAKILGVDAVIKCNYTYEKTGSEAGAIAKTLLFGVGGNSAIGALTMQINNGKDGMLLWRFYKEMGEGAFSSANDMMERMMRKVSRNFPYEK